jgi:hypothetical protein
MLKEVCRERGIPLLALDFDSFDPRIMPEETIHNKISEFLSAVVFH